MNTTYNITLLLLAFFFSFAALAQENDMESAAALFNSYSYADAVKEYEQIASRGHKSAELYSKLGDAYYNIGELEKAGQWYEELFSLNQEVDAEYFYRYAQTLKAAGDYNKANKILDVFSQKADNDIRAKHYLENKDYLIVIHKNSGRYAISKTDINSAYSDYGPAYFEDYIVFATSRDTTGLIRRVDGWTNHSFTELYQARIKGDSLSPPEKFSKRIATRVHESTPVFTKDGKTMYFTRNNYHEGKIKKDSTGRILLKIYRATLKDGAWTDITELPFNSNEYSIAHPALSADGEILYFASDMPGSYGEADIFSVRIDPDGTFGIPQNLGSGVNTQGRESFPFVDRDNHLYFASDGHPGLGGLDIYVSKPEKGEYVKAFNVGEPINSNRDDFAFIIDGATKTGYFSSNRGGGLGYDDIYGFSEIREIEFDCTQLLAGSITEESTGKALPDARVSLFDNERNLLKTTVSGTDGTYRFTGVECGKAYIVKSEKSLYTTGETSITMPQRSGETILPLTQTKLQSVYKLGTDLAKAFKIEQIYFDLAKYNIRPDAAHELDKIVKFMTENPTVRIDVRTHTDCRASDKYNKTLSENRAKSVIAYIVRSGIPSSRITGRGYGETRLVNKCEDGVRCTEEEHQQNRRSEFIIVAM